MPICKPKLTDAQQKEQEKLLKLQRYKYEEDLISFYGIQAGVDFHIYDVPVTWRGNEYTVHTFQGGHKNQDVLVLFHGYGGANVHYGRVYKELCQQFRVFSIDLPGMGLSSKQNIKLVTIEEVEEFFCEILEEWRKALNLQSFCLGGHSFGGYIAAMFALKHPNQVKHLFLLSPAGTTNYTAEEIAAMQNFEHLPWYKKAMVKYAQGQWSQQVTPQKVIDRWYGKFLVGRYLNKRMRLEGVELELWKRYTEVVVTLPEGSENALFILFMFPRVIAKNSIQGQIMSKIHSIKFPITFYFGRSDWMDNKGALQLADQYQFVKVRIIEDAGHQLQFENPAGVAGQLIQDFRFFKSLPKKEVDIMEEEEKDQDALSQENESYQAFIQQQ